MGADFVAVAVDVSKDEAYWLREIADRNDVELLNFLAHDRTFLWDRYFANEDDDRNAVVKTLRANLLDAIFIAYHPGRDSAWLNLDGKWWSLTGEHSWGDVGETFDSLALFSSYQAYLNLQRKHVEEEIDDD